MVRNWLSMSAAVLSLCVGVSADQVARPRQAQSEEVVGGRRGVLPVGQEFDVRMNNRLSSETSVVEQRFEATTVDDIVQDGRVIVPAGSVVQGVVSSVDPAGRLLDRKGKMTLAFDRLSVRGRDYRIRGSATEVFESGGIKDEAGTAGVGAGVGGVIGGLLGGVKGAVIGAVVGAGGAIAATDGKDVVIPVGSIVRVRLDSRTRVG